MDLVEEVVYTSHQNLYIYIYIYILMRRGSILINEQLSMIVHFYHIPSF